MRKRFSISAFFAFLAGCILLQAQTVEETLKGVSDITEGRRSEVVSEYMDLQRIPLPGGVQSINTMEQDEDGMVWLGTDRGLYAYDGYTFYNHSRNGRTEIRTGINTLLRADDNLILGSGNGIFTYSLKTEDLTQDKSDYAEVTALCRLAGRRWVGTRDGLYAESGDERTEILYTHVRALAAAERDSVLWVGTVDGLMRYDVKKDTCNPIFSSSLNPRQRVSVTVLLSDTAANRLWIGTEGDLFCYEWDSGRMIHLAGYRGINITALAFDPRGRMLVGSVEGFYVERDAMPETFPENNIYTTQPQHILHDTRDVKSLPCDEVRSLMVDKDGDLWVGTSRGLALHVLDEAAPFVPIWQFTGVSRGNTFQAFLYDSKGHLWMGGSNGLIQADPSLEKPEKTRWYTTLIPEFTGGRNSVTQVYEDRKQDIWVASATGVYLKNGDAWRQYVLEDADGYLLTNYNAVLVDESDRVWIASHRGPLFVSGKERMLSSDEKNAYKADIVSIDTAQGLAAMNVTHLAEVGHEVWALMGDSGILAVSKTDFSIRNIELPRGLDEKPSVLSADPLGRLWLGVQGGMLCWDLTALSEDTAAVPQRYYFPNFSKSRPLGFASVGNALWVTTTDGVWVATVGDTVCKRIRELGHPYQTICYAPDYDCIYLGAEDGLTAASPEELNQKLTVHPIQLVAIEVNGEMTYVNGWQSLRDVEYMGFAHYQNNLVFHFSDFPYNRLVKDRFVYRLRNREKEWLPMPPGVGRIEYHDLPSGNYWIEVSRVGSDGELLNMLSVPFKIYSPWYFSWWAFLLYLGILAAIAVLGAYLWYTRNRLRIERQEKKRGMELTRDKMKLYADMSRDFMEPINGIVSPLSDVLKEQRDGDSKLKTKVEEANGNALLLSKMVHRLLDFDRIENDVNSPLMLTHQDIYALLRDTYENYQEGAFRRNGLTSSFTGNVTECLQLVDKIKLISVFTNVLSNAARYTPRGGHVDVDFLLSGRYIIITVSDNGMGIPEKDLPYITSERYHRVSNNRRSVHSSGQGLYLSRLYVEMHGGTFDIQSKENAGTKVTMSWVHDADLGPASVEETKSEADSRLMRLEDDDFVERLTTVIVRNMDDVAFDGERLCKMIGLGKEAVNTRLVRECGMKIHEYILSMRLKKAAQLLEARYSLLEVMYYVGIRDKDEFIHEFVSAYGMTPQEYAEKH